jgi:hypothetical protein
MTQDSAMSRRLLAVLVAAVCAVPLGCMRPVDLGAVADDSTAQKIREALRGEGSGAAAAAAPVGTGWATLKGTFTFDSGAPAMPPYNVVKDPEVCAPGGQPRAQEFLLVDDATKGIANIVVFARNASRVHESAQPSNEPLVFDQKDCVFLTHVLGVPVGAQVQIKNSDPVGHNTKIDGTSFNQMIPANGVTLWTAQKEQASPMGVHCNVHPWMIAYMLPRKNSYFAVTAKDGTFEIPNLPAGEEIELQIWHEHAAGSQGRLFVESDEAKALKWSRNGRIKIKLEENKTREIKITVPTSAFKPV